PTRTPGPAARGPGRRNGAAPARTVSAVSRAWDRSGHARHRGSRGRCRAGGAPAMTSVSFGGLLVVAVIALAAPLLVSLAPAAGVPAAGGEVGAGIVVGPSGLGWVRVDTPIGVLGLLGLAFLLFLAGAELDLERLRGPLLRLAGAGFVASVGLGLAAG